jgi:hypothetical protein
VRVLRRGVLEEKKEWENIWKENGTLVHSFGKVRRLQKMILLVWW